MPTISSMREALLCQNLASGSGRPFALQLKLDTGMARLGADWQDGPGWWPPFGISMRWSWQGCIPTWPAPMRPPMPTMV